MYDNLRTFYSQTTVPISDPVTVSTGLNINTFNRRSSISELLFKSLSDRNPDVMQIAHQRRQFREELYFRRVNYLIVVDEIVLA